MVSDPRPARRCIVMVALVVAGESCFAVPFLIPRVFRPTLLDAFGISNFEFGTAVSVYGTVAMVSYFLGGPLADRFSARALMSSALLASATGGIWLATIPPLWALKILYGFWGISTILLFWAALIRATREYGGEATQGLAFGVLDGGRGLFAAMLASGGVTLFALVLPADTGSASLAERTQALQQVIWLYAAFVAVAAVMVWVCVPPRATTPAHEANFSLRSATTVLRNRAVWLQGVIVLCAYTAYKGMDDFVLFARDAFEFDDVQSARVGTLALWTRPAAALGAGLLADRIGHTRAILACFCGVLAGNSTVALGWLQPSLVWALYMTVVVTGAMVYGLRGVYFTLFRQAQVSNTLTGTATGLVSVIGYTPDVFSGPMMGYFTDTWPGALGHRYLFAVLAAFALLGIAASLLFRSVSTRPS